MPACVDLIFCQQGQSLGDAATLKHRASRDAGCVLVVEQTVPGPFGDAVRLRMARDGREVRMFAMPRAATESDLAAVREVEATTGAAGLGDLAARCSLVFELSTESGSDRALALEVAALIASFTLGPILPAERDAIFGVRGARERARSGND